MNPEYTYPLGITSQFSFCGLPLRLDTYSGCAFSCTYCFARLRGGKTASKKLRAANPEVIIDRFRNSVLKPTNTTGIISETIRKRMPVHFGGMSDPFQPIEATKKVSLRVLEYLCNIHYPIVISTRSTLLSTPLYLNVLKENPNVLVQFSFSSLEDEISRVTEPFANKPSDVMKSINILSRQGINVSIRWQPYIPRVSESIEQFVSRASNLGVKHIGFEHLKLPVEKESVLWKRLSSALNFDIREFYKSEGSTIDGREYILPPAYKLQNVLLAKRETNKRHMTFGAADNEFQYLSNNSCCCSGADQFEGFENWNKFQIAHAIKKSNFRDITFDLIRDEWQPQGAIDRHLNSHSRIENNGAHHNRVYEYVVDRWENLDSDFNPTKFFGVEFNGKRDAEGFRIYSWNDQTKAISDLDLQPLFNKNTLR